VSASRRLLRLVFGLVPIVAGLDKFLGLLADWEGYLLMAAAAFSLGQLDALRAQVPGRAEARVSPGVAPPAPARS